MSAFHVKVKWGKEMYPDIELDTGEPPMVFKAQLFALTGVQPHRQKIMLRGATIKDDTWDGIKMKDGVTILMMGSKEEDVPVEPTEKTSFIEDMTEAERNTLLELPVGIKNLGNTCYLNAVVQCLKTVPELHTAIRDYKPKQPESSSLLTLAVDSASLITLAVQDCYKTMNSGKTAVPLVLVNLFRTTFPRFAEQGEQGMFMQQDASECWTELMRLLMQEVPAKESDKTAANFRSSLLDQYFTGEFSCEWKCVESEEEEVTKTTDNFQQLLCHISQDVKYLHTGLVARMQEQITKKSATLDRDAVYTKKSKISRLPAYLSVEMVRFFYKEKEAVNAKILKDVKFPMVLDVFELCTEDLQKRLLPNREKYKDMEEREIEEERAMKRGKPGAVISKPKTRSLPFSFEDDLGSNNSGFYQLQAVLTHQGRSSSSGHYVSWIRWKGKEWLKCDDDEVTPVTEEEILKLSGGGDWHCAYILLYGPRILEVVEEEEEKAGEEAKMETN
ncbi:ubiquitin carboxyl-terminal hydrolase 14-like [Macrobrachium nipponense]|uniref:ubiquitin carboxyl-terminal hydrolase 14-like n=1 Tax=Macrobrachium nipponense TaxID=159736 RepID=UPI0030C82F3E